MPFSASEIAELNARLREKSPEQIIVWAVERFGPRLAAQASMQKTAGVIMHLLSRIAPGTEIIFVDTGVHFPETIQLRDEFTRRYGLNIRTYAPARTFDEQAQEFGGRYLHQFDSEDGGAPGYQLCCELRKEVPYLEAVKGRFDAVLGGLMRAEGGARSTTQVCSYDPRLEILKIYPLAFASEEFVESYTAEHDLPVHPLYALGYASIGCAPCTTPLRPGEPRRAGRWRHIREQSGASADTHLYCGINFEDRKKKAPVTPASPQADESQSAETEYDGPHV
jgi:phosphoadenosine phosphosulfate reductase